MKKIVGIIAALALAGSVFADPSVTPVIATFDGNASLEWIADLDAETTGMKNSESATFKVKFISEGTKENEAGDGLWGELKIKAGNTEVEAKNDGVAKSGVAVANPTVESAKIHFSDDDFYARVNIKAPGLKVGGGKNVLATFSDKGTADNPNPGVTVTGAQGFTVEFGLKDFLDFNLQFADNGQKKSSEKEFGFAFDAKLNGAGIDVEGLELYAGVAYATEKVSGASQDAAIAARASYKLAIDDKLYLKPTVGFGLKGDAKELAAAVLFGWGAENAEAKFDAYANSVSSVHDKCTDGVSFALKSNLESKDDGGYMGFFFGVYDSTFVPGLKVGAEFVSDFYTIGDGFTLDFAAKYSNTFDIWKIDANAGLKLDKAADTNVGFRYAFELSTDNSLIQNTKLYAKYAGEQSAKIGGADKKGTITVGTQIHF